MPPLGGIIFAFTRRYPIRLPPLFYLHPRLYPFYRRFTALLL